MSKPHWRWLTDLTFKRREEVSPELLPDAHGLLEAHYLGAAMPDRCVSTVPSDAINQGLDILPAHQFLLHQPQF